MNWPLIAAVVVVVGLVLFMEIRSARPVEPVHSLDCRDGVADENCLHRAHLTREEIETLNSLDNQIGFKP